MAVDYKGLTQSLRGANRFAQALYNQQQMKLMQAQRRAEAEEERRRKKGGLLNTVIGGIGAAGSAVLAPFTGGASLAGLAAFGPMLGGGVGQMSDNQILGQGISALGTMGAQMGMQNFAESRRAAQLESLLGGEATRGGLMSGAARGGLPAGGVNINSPLYRSIFG